MTTTHPVLIDASMFKKKACDHVTDTGFCDRSPVLWVALVGAVPMLWSGETPKASLGFFCCKEHADAEPAPALADAKAMLEKVLDAETAVLWRRLIDNYAAPLPLD